MSISWALEIAQLIKSSPAILLTHGEARVLCNLCQLAFGFVTFPPGAHKSQRGRVNHKNTYSMQRARRHLLETKLSVLSVERTEREETQLAAQQRESGLIPNPPQTHSTAQRNQNFSYFVLLGNCNWKLQGMYQQDIPEVRIEPTEETVQAWNRSRGMLLPKQRTASISLYGDFWTVTKQPCFQQVSKARQTQAQQGRETDFAKVESHTETRTRSQEGQSTLGQGVRDLLWALPTAY